LGLGAIEAQAVKKRSETTVPIVRHDFETFLEDIVLLLSISDTYLKILKNLVLAMSGR
jgi:hypothetical protein